MSEQCLAGFSIATIQGTMLVGKVKRDSGFVDSVVQSALAHLNSYRLPAQATPQDGFRKRRWPACAHRSSHWMRRGAPRGAALIDLGSHRLKDLTEPEQVWQLTIAGLRAEFPPLQSLGTVPNNLPIQPTSFRGREHDLEEMKSLLAQHRQYLGDADIEKLAASSPKVE